MQNRRNTESDRGNVLKTAAGNEKPENTEQDMEQRVNRTPEITEPTVANRPKNFFGQLPQWESET